MESGTNGVKESTYSVIAFPGYSLPQQYQNMILSQWMRSLKHGNEYFKLADSDAFYEAYGKYIKSILGRASTTVRIAVLGDDRDVALGWSVVEGSALHFIRVQYEQRNRGIGRSLVPEGIDTITHLTKAGARIWPRCLPAAIFNPFK